MLEVSRLNRRILGSIPKLKTATVAILFVGLAVRCSLAPYSAGSDVPQFYGFARIFLEHGLSFYRYMPGELWPYPWPYAYPPLWILVLSVLAILDPGEHVKTFDQGGVFRVFVDQNWIMDVKSILMGGDILAGVLIYRIVGGGLKGFISVALWLFNPMVIYVSSIYGMFDVIPLLFILLAIELCRKEKHVLAGVSIGLAAMFKQSALPAVLPLIFYVAGRNGWRSSARILASAIIVSTIIMLPFAIVGGLPSIMSAILKPGLEEGICFPIQYSHNGYSSLISLLSMRGVVDYTWVFKYWLIFFSTALIIVCLQTYKGKYSIVEATWLGYASYTIFYWNMHAQHLIPLIALTILLLFEWDVEKSVILVPLLVAESFWPTMFPVSWWFYVHVEKPNTEIARMLYNLSLKAVSDEAYVAYGIVLTGLISTVFFGVILSKLSKEFIVKKFKYN